MDLAQHKVTSIEVTKSRSLREHGFVTKIIIRSVNDQGQPVTDYLTCYHGAETMKVKQLEEEFAY